MNRQSALRAGTAALHLLLLSGGAVSLIFAAPAAAQVSPSQLQKYDGVFRWTSANTEWFDLDMASGQLVGTMWGRWDDRLEKKGNFTLDTAQSTSSKLVGSLTFDGRPGGQMEVFLSPDGNGLAQVRRMGDLTIHSFFRRVDQLGSRTGALTRAQVEERFRGRWKTPIGDLLIEGGPGLDRTGPPMTGKIFRPDGTTIRYLLNGPLFQGGEDSEQTVWRWSTPGTSDTGQGLIIAISPDGAMLSAYIDNSYNKGVVKLLGGVQSWLATKVGATSWEPVNTPATAPAPAPVPPPSTGPTTEQQQPASWQGFWAASSEGKDQSQGYIDLKSHAGVLGGTQWIVDSAGPRDVGQLTIDSTKSTADKLVGTALYDGSQAASVILTMAPNGSFASMVTTVGQRTAGTYLRRVANIGSVPVATTGAALRNAMIGSWQTNLGTLRIAEQGTGLVGTITRYGEAVPTHSMTLSQMHSSSEYQDWTMTRATSGGGSLRVVLAPDGKSLMAFPLSHSARLFGDLPYLEARRSGATVPSSPAPAPKPGYTSCDDWCEVKIVTSTVINLPVDGGKLAPMTVLDVAVHNKTAEYRTLQPIFIGTETIGFVGSAGSFDHSKPALTSDGPMNMATNAAVGKWPYVMQPIGLAPGAEVRVTHVLGGKQVPQNLDRLLLVYQGQQGVGAKRTEMPGGQQLLCAHYAAEQKLKAAGTLAFPVGALPAQCGSPSDPLPQTPAPAPPASQPPAPPPMAAQPSTPLPATVPAGIFHSLQRFDVRMDQVRAGRDGKVHLFVTVANKSGAEQSLGQETLSMVMTDADGVGIYTGTPYRVDGEEPVHFNVTPTIPAGGELKVRYVMAPPRLHGPISRVGLRESDAKILFFDASAGDDGTSNTSAPPPGSGSFKSLSKLDVRIDRAGSARDGKFEAFLTFRNPGRQPASINAAEQRLSGVNSDGSRVSAGALWSIRGERGVNDGLPTPVYVEAGGQIRVRYVFENAPSGALTITDGTITQTFTPGG